MAELSSLIFVDLDELGRPTGLIAANEEDTIATSILPSSVNDAVSSVQQLSGLVDVAPILTGLPDDFSDLSSDVNDLSSDVGTFQAQIDAVSGLTGEGTVQALLDLTGDINDLSNDVGSFQSQIDAVSGLTGEGTVDSLLALTGLEDVSNVIADSSTSLGFITGTIPGLCAGPDVLVASALSTLADYIRVVDEESGKDEPDGNEIVIRNSRIRPRQGALLMSNSEQTAFLKVQNDSPNLNFSDASIAYLSGQFAGLVGYEDILIGRTASQTVLGIGGTPENPTATSSLLGAYTNQQVVTGIVDAGSGVMVSLSGDRGDGYSIAESLSSLNQNLFVADPTGPGTPSINLLGDVSGTNVVFKGENNVTFISENDTFNFGSSVAETTEYNTEDFIKTKEAKDEVVTTSGNWNNTYTSVNTTSGNWDSTYTSVNNTSGDWDSTYNDVNASAVEWNSTRDTVFENSGTWDSGGGGGGDTQEASALKITGGSPPYTYASINGSAAEGDILVFNGTNFFYRTAAFAGEAGGPTSPLTFTAPSGDVTYNFGPSASVAGGNTLDFSGSFTSSGLTKTLLEFNDKSRVALGRNSVPLEISALGESDIRLEDDGTNGAFVLIKGDNTADTPIPSNLHLQSANLSADADSQIDFDTDINMGGSTHLVGNTIGANHIACRNEHGSTLTAGTPVYIKGFVGSGAAGIIEIGAASASVASAMPAIGVLSEDLDDDIEGYVDAFGVADGIDTDTPGFSLQDTLYVAPTGGLTNVRPTATSDLVQNIGIVERVDSSNGKIIVLGPGRTNDVPTSVNNEVTFASAITVNNTLTANGGTGSTHPTAGGQVLQSRGSNSVTWGNKKKLRWYESDFHSADVRINGPWLGAAINSGTTGGGPAAALYTEMMGAVLLRSSTTANSGYSWDTQAFDRIAPRKNLFFECIFAIPDDFTNKTAKLGFYDDATNTTAGVDGTYFLIDNSGNMTPETSNNSTRTTGTSYSLSVDTVYKAQIWWNGSSSVVFKITNMDESTVHASEVINTNVPSGTARRFGAGLVTESSGTATDDLLVLDYMGWGLYPYREDDSL